MRDSHSDFVSSGHVHNDDLRVGGRPRTFRHVTGFRRPLHGFTLIELLVVIAIISVLVSVLLPSLNKARDLARSVVCQSDLRGYGLVLGMFTNEYDGRYPQHMSTGQADDGYYHEWYHWPVTLHRAGFTDLPGRYLYEDKDAPYDKYKGCSTPGPTQPDPPAVNTIHCYMYNQALWKHAKADTIPNIQETVAWTDGYRDAATIVYKWDGDAYAIYPNIGNWHNEGANTVFTDGHVEHIEKNRDNMRKEMWKVYDGNDSRKEIIPGWVNFPVE